MTKAITRNKDSRDQQRKRSVPNVFCRICGYKARPRPDFHDEVFGHLCDIVIDHIDRQHPTDFLGYPGEYEQLCAQKATQERSENDRVNPPDIYEVRRRLEALHHETTKQTNKTRKP